MLPILILSLRALAHGRRLLVVGLLLLVPAILELVQIQTASSGSEDSAHFAVSLFDNLALPVLIPLTAMLFATSALGSEIEDRTLIYLTLRPVSRLGLVVAKYLAAALVATALTGISLLLLGLAASSKVSSITYTQDGHLVTQGSLIGPFLASGLAGILAYSSLFLLLGILMPRRALLVGFVYILGWEGLAAGLSTGLATFSIRRYVQGMLDAALGASPLATIQSSTLTGATSVLVLALVVVVGIVLTTIRLRTTELP
jgi:ABC-2 type transport system permease protein